MATVTIQEAQAKLADLIHNLAPGGEVVITENNHPVAKLVGEQPRSPPGLGKGCLTIVSDNDAEKACWASPARSLPRFEYASDARNRLIEVRAYDAEGLVTQVTTHAYDHLNRWVRTENSRVAQFACKLGLQEAYARTLVQR